MSFYRIVERMNQLQRSFSQMNKGVLEGSAANRKTKEVAKDKSPKKFEKILSSQNNPKVNKGDNLQNKDILKQVNAIALQAKSMLNAATRDVSLDKTGGGIATPLALNNVVKNPLRFDIQNKYQSIIDQINKSDLAKKARIKEVQKSEPFAQSGVKKYDDLVSRASKMFDMPKSLINAVIKVESNFDEKAVSSKGAMGLMQLMPETAKRMEVTDVFDPWQNISGGVSYLKSLIKNYDGNLVKALGAYNAGVDAVYKYQDKVPNYSETQNYVKKVMHNYMKNNGVRQIKG